METVRQKQKLVGVVAIRNSFEILFCAGIHGNNDIEPFASRFLNVECGNSALDLGNGLVPRQCPMSSIRIDPTNRVNTMWSGPFGCDDVVYAEVFSHGDPRRAIPENSYFPGL